MTSEMIDRDWSGLQIIGEAECLRLMSGCAIGRLGFVDAGSPVILPVNFAVDGRSVVFRTARGSKLTAGAVQRPVCFEVDSWNPSDHTGWSVVAKGVADEVFDGDEVERLDRLPVRPWSSPELRTNWVRVLVEEISGRRIVPT